MTGQEVMSLLQITRPVLYRLIDKKILTPINLPANPKIQKRPRRFLFDRAAVEALAATPGE